MREALTLTKKITVSIFSKYLKIIHFMSSHHFNFLLLMVALWLMFMLPVIPNGSYSLITRTAALISTISVAIVYYYEEISHSNYKYRICLCALIIGIATFLQAAIGSGII